VRIALDATYSTDSQPTGIGTYSQALLIGLAERYPQDRFLHCYRPKQFLKTVKSRRRNVSRRLLYPALLGPRADVFHALNQRVERRPAKKVVTTFHDLFVMTEEYSSPAFRARFADQARRAAANSDLIIAVSQFTANQVSELLGFDPSRIRVIPHGVSPPSPQLARKREKIILFVGALQVRKNVARLVEAFEHTPPDWRLILAGASTGYRAESIMQRIRNSPSRDRIQITGYLWPAELQTLYSRASIFAFPSLDEGFGIPLLEAMAHGVPVITSNRPALVEVAGDAALLVDPEKTEDIEGTLNELIFDPHLRADLAQRGRDRASLFPWERAITETSSVYQELSG
jgi:glycosyltransferase involved in cell wall biosynthesis